MAEELKQVKVVAWSDSGVILYSFGLPLSGDELAALILGAVRASEAKR